MHLSKYSKVFFYLVFVPALHTTEVTQNNIKQLMSEHDIEKLHTYEKFLALWKQDLFEYYNLRYTYDTPLKRKEFTKTAEYTQLLEDLNYQRENLTEKEFSITAYRISQYDLATGSFLVGFDFTENPSSQYIIEKKGLSGWEKYDAKKQNYGTPTTAYFPNAIQGLLFPKLGLKSEKKLEKAHQLFDSNEKLSQLRVRVPEKEAVMIEKEKADFRINYKIKGLVKKSVKYDRTVLDSFPEYHKIEFELFECTITQMEFVGEKERVIYILP